MEVEVPKQQPQELYMLSKRDAIEKDRLEPQDTAH